MVKPDAYQSMGKMIDMIYGAGFTINKLKMSKFSKATAEQFYGEHKGKPFYNNLMEFITSDVAIGLELVAEDAVKRWRSCIGPTSTFVRNQLLI
jgi:nucleoside-diphosphate kinase